MSNSDAFATIKANFERWSAAWNAGDLDGYLACYHQSDDTRWISGGQLVKGYEAIATAYRERFVSDDGAGQMRLTHVSPEILTDTDALIFGAWELQSNGEIYNGVFHAHLKFIEGQWLIVTDHATMFT